MNARTTTRTERKIGLGWTADRYRVVATVALEEPDAGRTSTYTDHHEGPAPLRFAVMFDMVKGSDWGGGQVPSEDRVIARRHEDDASPELAEWIDAAWRAHHLNDMHAECDHMMPEMLARREDESTGEWQTRMLDTVVCPETGYKWGRAWLARELPADVIATARNIIADGTAAEIVKGA